MEAPRRDPAPDAARHRLPVLPCVLRGPGLDHGRRTARRSTPCAGCWTSSAGWSATTSRPTWPAAGTTTGGRRGGPTCSRRTRRTGSSSGEGDGPDVEEVPDPLEVAGAGDPSTCSTAFGIAVVGADGYEADDVIGTLATQATMPIDIVTGDRDLFQLVDDAAGGARAVRRPRASASTSGSPTTVVREKYGVDAHQYADFATLRGDASDGLPGVGGVGDKTAATLLRPLRRHGRAAARRSRTPTPTWPPGPRRKLRDAADYLAVAPTGREGRLRHRPRRARPHAAAHPDGPRRAGRAGRAVGAGQPDRPAGGDAHRPVPEELSGVRRARGRRRAVAAGVRAPPGLAGLGQRVDRVVVVVGAGQRLGVGRPRCGCGSSSSSTRCRARGRTRRAGAPSACRRTARRRRSAASRSPGR